MAVILVTWVPCFVDPQEVNVSLYVITSKFRIFQLKNAFFRDIFFLVETNRVFFLGRKEIRKINYNWRHFIVYRKWVIGELKALSRFCNFFISRFYIIEVLYAQNVYWCACFQHICKCALQPPLPATKTQLFLQVIGEVFFLAILSYI